MAVEYTATARVTLTVEVLIRSHWGTGCTIDQVHKQAAEEAVGFIENQVSQKFPEARARLHIVGKPKVDAVIVANPAR